MKTKLLAVTAFAIGTCVQLFAQGYIVPNGVTQVNSGSTFGLHVIQNPSNGDYTGFLLNSQSATTFLFNPVVDEGVRTFLVSPNDAISLQPILANNYPELTFPNTYTFANGSPFYLGFYTGYNPWASDGSYTGIYTDPVFGWARLVNINGTIQLLDSALEYGGGGIYVGTQTIIPVPEPSSLALAAIGCFVIWRSRRRLLI